MKFEYAEQPKPEGLAQAFWIGEEFLAGNPACLVLGDNIFYGNSISGLLEKANNQQSGATVFGYPVRDPERYGVVEFDESWNVLSIEEKPQIPKSNYAVPGLYFYDENVIELARQVQPSARGEYEITTLNQMYLEQGKLKVQIVGRGIAWFDTGTHGSLLQAANFVEAIEERQGLMIACPEEIAYLNEWINRDDVLRIASEFGKSSYAEYVRQLVSA